MSIDTITVNETGGITTVQGSGAQGPAGPAGPAGSFTGQITGTAHEITATLSGGNYTLSTPQDIDITSSVAFAAMSLTSASSTSVPLTVQGAPSQAGKLLSFKDSSGNSLNWFDANGAFTVPHTHTAIQASGGGQVMYIDLIGSGVMQISNGGLNVVGGNGVQFVASPTMNVYAGSNGLLTFGTNTYYGLVYVSNNAGAPVNPPADTSDGRTPMFFDTTNSKLWAYIGGAWKSALFT